MANEEIIMPIDAMAILMLLGATVLIGYIGAVIFRRTRIPDILWLLVFGFAASFFIDKSIFISAFPLLSALAIMFIMFDAGLNIRPKSKMTNAKTGAAFALATFFISITFLGLLASRFLSLTLMEGLLLSAALVTTSSETVITMLKSMKIRQNVRDILDFESIIKDPLSIVVAIILVGFIQNSAALSFDLSPAMFNSLLGGIAFGLIGGMLWLKVKNSKRLYHVLTISFLFMLYASAEMLIAGGAFAAIVFGLILGNNKLIYKIHQEKQEENKKHFDHGTIRSFQAEVTFFIKSFFFVFIGLIADVSVQYIAYGVILAVGVIILRFFIVSGITLKMNLPKTDRDVSTFMVPLGLSAALLSTMPLTYGLTNLQFFPSIVFVVMIATLVYTTISAYIVEIFSDKNERRKIQ